MKKEKNNYLHHPFQLYNIESLRHDHGFSTGPCLFQYSERTVIIEQVIIKYLALFLLYSVKVPCLVYCVLFRAWFEQWIIHLLVGFPTVLTTTTSECIANLKGFIFASSLWDEVNDIIVCTLQKGGHDTEILKHLLNPSVQTEICKVKFHQNTYICHIIIDSFSRSQSGPLENKEHNHDPQKTFCF